MNIVSSDLMDFLETNVSNILLGFLSGKPIRILETLISW